MLDTQNLSRFELFEIDQNETTKITGGWSETVKTATGTVTHVINEYTEAEYWVLHGDVSMAVDHAQELADRGDHQ